MGKRRLTHITETEGGDKNSTKESEAGSDDETPVEVKPVGDVIKRSNKGKAERRHYEAVELDGVRYELEDAVLVAPEQRGEKPYVAIIKEIKQAKDGSVAVTGQWFYRPEEAEKKGGGSWTSFDSRELFYSFHRDEVPAESVMHKCVVHFIPPLKQPPLRTKHPGFIIRQVYDTVEKKLWKLTDKDYEDSKQKEIDLLVQKTRDALGDLPNIEGEEISLVNEAEEVDKGRRQFRRRAVPPLRVSREDSSEATDRGDAPLSGKVDTPSSCKTPGSAFSSDIMDLLRAHNALTGQTARDRWLEKILSTLKFVLDTDEPRSAETGEPEGSNNQHQGASLQANTEPKSAANDGDGMKDKKDMVPKSAANDGVGMRDKKDMWPESAISAASSLEKVAYEFHGSDVHKYNLKMRQLDFNLKKSPVLSRRLLSKDLEPSTVFHMTPVELKDGFTAAETKAREPPELETLQMTDARCGICGEREVGVKDIIHVGYGDRYQLECLKCGNSWYASRDSVSSLTTRDQNFVSPTVGLAPWATSKFEEVEKELVSPRESDRPIGDQENVSPLPAKTDELEGTNAPESQYVAIERMLTEHISVPGPASFAQEQSKLDVEAKVVSEKSDDKVLDKVDQLATGDHEVKNQSDDQQEKHAIVT